MSAQAMQACLDSTDVKKFVHHFAKKLHYQYPSLLDVEDAQHELWLSVFRAVNERWTPEKPLVRFAMSAAFSRYGHMADHKGNRARLLHEKAVAMKTYYHPTIEDYNFDAVETLYTLDQIEHDLMDRAGEGRNYRIAIRLLRSLRNGYTVREAAEDVGVSPRKGYQIFDICRKAAEKYR